MINIPLAITESVNKGYYPLMYMWLVRLNTATVPNEVTLSKPMNKSRDKTRNFTESSEIDIKLWSEFMEEILSEETPWPPFLLPSLMILIFIVGFVGNLLTCIVIYYDKTMHTATNFYLFNLAVSDLLVSIAILLEVYELLSSDNETHYAFGDLTCKIHFFLVVVLWNNGILVMTALAMERYVAICHPLMLKSTPVWRRVTKILVFIWIIAIAETLPEFWTVSLVQTKKASLCFTVPTHFAKIVNGVLAIVTFLIPLCIMTFVYAMIAFQMNVVQKNSANGRNFNYKDNTSKVNKLIALTLSFLVCWVPFFTIRVLIYLWDARRLIEVHQWWTIWYKICTFNNWFSAVLNPLLFSLMSTKFRQSLKALWRKTKTGQTNRHPELYTIRTSNVFS